MAALKNFCVEPETPQCICARRFGCGGLLAASERCPEHGVEAKVGLLMKTHFHEVKGLDVGTEELPRYDKPKAS